MNKYLEKIASSNWIAGATKHKGKLHENLGIPEGQPIPESTLEEAAKRPGKVGKEARLAETLKGMKHLKKTADDTSSSPGKTALHETIASIPADVVGVGLGAKLGTKLKLDKVNFGKMMGGEHNIGGMAGAALGGLAANYAVLKHQQMKQQG